MDGVRYKAESGAFATNVREQWDTNRQKKKKKENLYLNLPL